MYIVGCFFLGVATAYINISVPVFLITIINDYVKNKGAPDPKNSLPDPEGFKRVMMWVVGLKILTSLSNVLKNLCSTMKMNRVRAALIHHMQGLYMDPRGRSRQKSAN